MGCPFGSVHTIYIYILHGPFRKEMHRIRAELLPHDPTRNQQMTDKDDLPDAADQALRWNLWHPRKTRQM